MKASVGRFGGASYVYATALLAAGFLLAYLVIGWSAGRSATTNLMWLLWQQEVRDKVDTLMTWRLSKTDVLAEFIDQFEFFDVEAEDQAVLVYAIQYINAQEFPEASGVAPVEAGALVLAEPAPLPPGDCKGLIGTGPEDSRTDSVRILKRLLTDNGLYAWPATGTLIGSLRWGYLPTGFDATEGKGMDMDIAVRSGDEPVANPRYYHNTAEYQGIVSDIERLFSDESGFCEKIERHKVWLRCDIAGKGGDWLDIYVYWEGTDEYAHLSGYLYVPIEWVNPLQPCLWAGQESLCPRRSIEVLNHWQREYPPFVYSHDCLVLPDQSCNDGTYCPGMEEVPTSPAELWGLVGQLRRCGYLSFYELFRKDWKRINPSLDPHYTCDALDVIPG